MQVFERIGLLRPLTIVWIIYGLVWITLEGAIWSVVLMAVLTTAVSILTLLQKRLGGKVLSRGKFVGITAVAGLTFGLGSALLTLLFMALKTGLHTHGPEFSQAEIEWIIHQIPLWTMAGLLLGLGTGLVIAGAAKTEN